ncbi:MAG: hypothetical protein OEY14_08210 [Myxococcales bacterium]|nr:hypothetical protein [Myxococcales bacterium]
MKPKLASTIHALWLGAILALPLLPAGCTSTEPLTEVLLVADTDLQIPSELDTIRFEVQGPDGTTRTASASLGGGAARPATLGLVHRGGPLGPMRATVEGLQGGSVRVRREARFSLIAGETKMLRLDLLRSCLGQSCGAGETCELGACRPVDVEPAELEPWAGQPAGLDASLPPEGGVEGGVDGGPDGGPGCSSDASCDDGIACTTDSCDLGTGVCSNLPLDAACDDGLPCTNDVCDAVLGCVAPADHGACAPGSYCDAVSGCTTGPSFAEIYTMIIEPNCAPCHTVRSDGTLDMGTQAQAYLSLFGVTALCGGGSETRVLPRDSRSSLLWRKVADVDLCGLRMPPTGLALSGGDAMAIAQWIDSGALDL